MSFEFKIGSKIKVTGAACTKELYTKIIGYTGTIMEYPFHNNPNGKYVVNIDGVRNPDSTKGYFYIDVANMKLLKDTPNCSYLFKDNNNSDDEEDITTKNYCKVGDIVRFAENVKLNFGAGVVIATELENRLGVLIGIEDCNVSSIDCLKYTVTAPNNCGFMEIYGERLEAYKIFTKPFNTINDFTMLRSMLLTSTNNYVIYMGSDVPANCVYSIYNKLIKHLPRRTHLYSLIDSSVQIKAWMDEMYKSGKKIKHFCIVIRDNTATAIDLAEYTKSYSINLPMYTARNIFNLLIKDKYTNSSTNHKEENNMNTNKPKNKNSRNNQKSIHNKSVFRVSTETGERYISNGKHNGKAIPTITTIVSINGKVGKATCDKDNYNEREGIINALANMATGGNFDREYDKWTKYINAINTQKCTCKYCGTVYNTSADARDCESAHIAKKKAKHEAYMIRKEARNRIAMAEFENKVEEVMKSIYEKAKENAEASEAEDITDVEATVVSDVVTETTATTVEDTTTKSDNNTPTDATE